MEKDTRGGRPKRIPKGPGSLCDDLSHLFTKGLGSQDHSGPDISHVYVRKVISQKTDRESTLWTHRGLLSGLYSVTVVRFLHLVTDGKLKVSISLDGRTNLQSK